MTTKEALELVIELAEQNAIVFEDEANDKELQLEADRQSEAIEKLRAQFGKGVK